MGGTVQASRQVNLVKLKIKTLITNLPKLVTIRTTNCKFLRMLITTKLWSTDTLMEI